MNHLSRSIVMLALLSSAALLGCTQDCPAEFGRCGNACVPLKDDVLNCGACGHVCSDRELCVAGSCTLLSCDGGVCDVEQPGSTWDGGTRFVDGGVTPEGMPVFLNVGDLPSLASSPSDLPIERVREFNCNEQVVGSSSDISDVIGAPGESLVISPSGMAPCTFVLSHRRAGGVETQLSTTPGGYLIAGAASTGGLTMACASDAIHVQQPEGPVTARLVQQVPIRCWASTGADWTLPLEVVAGDPDWASWVGRVEPVPVTSGAFTLRYVRDSTFQFFNLSDYGRPSSDGVWEVALTVVGRSVVAGAATQISNSVRLDAPTSTDWVPTTAEVDDYGFFMTFDGGPCVRGCPFDGGT